MAVQTASSIQKASRNCASGETPTAERLVLCGGPKPAGGDPILRLALDGPSQNITLKIEDIAKRLVKNVPDLLVDLIEIAAYVYCVDQATSRGGDRNRAVGDAGDCASGLGGTLNIRAAHAPIAGRRSWLHVSEVAPVGATVEATA